MEKQITRPRTQNGTLICVIFYRNILNFHFSIVRVDMDFMHLICQMKSRNQPQIVIKKISNVDRFSRNLESENTAKLSSKS